MVLKRSIEPRSEKSMIGLNLAVLPEIRVCLSVGVEITNIKVDILADIRLKSLFQRMVGCLLAALMVLAPKRVCKLGTRFSIQTLIRHVLVSPVRDCTARRPSD